MPRPTAATTLQRPDLGAVAFEYMMDSTNRGFIGTQILPVFPVAEQSGDYPKIPTESLIKLPDSINRAARSAYQRGDYEFETGTYSCEEYGWEEPLDDSERKLYRRLFDAEMVAMMRAMDILLRTQEKRIAAAVFSTGNITNTGAVSTEWSTAATCTPKADVKDALSTHRLATGINANAMAISKKVFDNLMVTAEIKDYLQYTNPHLLANDEANRRLLAQYFGLEEVIVGSEMYDSAKKKVAMSLADIWDDEYALLFRKARNINDLREPTLGRTFLWEADSPSNIVTEQYREEQTRSDIYRVRQYVDEAFVFTGAGYLMSNITA